MSGKATIRWVVLALALLGYILVFERNQPTSREQQLASQQFLSELDPARVTRIEVIRTNGTIVALKREGRWQIADPPYPAQSGLIQSWLDRLPGLPLQTVVTADELVPQADGAEAFGLSTPQATVSLRQGDRDIQFAIGAESLVGNRVYVQREGEPGVFVTDARLLEGLPQTPSDWRDRRLVDLGDQTFTAFRVQSGEGRVFEIGQREGSEAWRLLSPRTARVDVAKVAQLLQQLLALQVEEFVEDTPGPDLDRFGLAPPQLSVELLQRTNQVLSIQFGKASPTAPDQVYARRSGYPNVVLVSGDVAQELAAPYTVFLDQRLVDRSLVPTRRVEVLSAAPFVLQQQTNGVWQIIRPELLLADPELVEAFLARVQALTILEIAKEVASVDDMAQFGLASPIIEYSFYDTPDKSGTNSLLAQLDVGGSRGSDVYVKRNDESSIYAVGLEKTLLLPRAGFELRDRRVWSFSTNEVQAVTLEAKAHTYQLLRGERGDWRFAADSQGMVNTFALEEAVFRLGQLQAHVWVAQGEEVVLGSYGLDPAAGTCTIKLLQSGEEKNRSISFGAPSPSGGPYALCEVDGQPTVFELPLETFVPYQEVVRGMLTPIGGAGAPR